MMPDKELEVHFRNACLAFDNKMYEKARKEFFVIYGNGVQVIALDIAETYYQEKNYEESIKWFHKVEEGQQKILAVLKLAKMYYDGKGTSVDKEKSFHLIYDLPKLSTPFRELNISIAYTAGEVVEQNFEIAYQFSKQAYDQGLLDGLERMAFLRKKQKKYLSWTFLRMSFISKAIIEIIRVYILNKKNKYIYIKDEI